MRIGNNRKWKREKKENKGMWDHTEVIETKYSKL